MKMPNPIVVGCTVGTVAAVFQLVRPAIPLPMVLGVTVCLCLLTGWLAYVYDWPHEGD